MKPKLQKHIDFLIQRYPRLEGIAPSIFSAYNLLETSYEQGGKLLVAGNGGSAADSEHIAGELMKRFKSPRPIDPALAERLVSIDPVRGEALSRNLEQSLMAIPRVAHEALSTAYINDVDGYGVFANSCWSMGVCEMRSWAYPPPETTKTL